jgi:3-oxoadipate enol-lactonase
MRHSMTMSSSVIDYPVHFGRHGVTTVRDIPGPAGSAAVMLLHGLGATSRINWGPSYRPLSKHFRVLSLDHRGHGAGLRTRRFRLEECADDAAGAAEARSLSSFIAVGYSMGGPIASLTWRRHPGQVRGLVLCATARHFVPRAVSRAARIALPAASGLARLAPSAAHDRMLQRMLARIEHPELRERVQRELGGHDPASVIQAGHALTGFSSHDWIGRIDVPTAVIVTTRDELVPVARQYKMAKSIPGAEIFEVDGDHSACLSRQDLFIPTLVEACRSVDRRSAKLA